MNRICFLFCASALVLFFLLPCAGAVCPGIVTPSPSPTYSPPGPYGTISVDSSPAGANVYLDGEARGTTPVTISGLWPGTYEITATLSGFERYTTTTTITGSARSVVFCPLVPGGTGSGSNGLTIISSPVWATVWLDGIERGVTPLTISGISPGTHRIRLTRSGYDDWESMFDPGEGAKTFSATLNPRVIDPERGINISSSPPGASVLIDGRARGFTPVTLDDAGAGIHVVQIDYPGYTSWKSPVTVPETGILDLSVTLDPKPGFSGGIRVISIPGNASVSLDGTPAGSTAVNGSLELDGIPAGEHEVSLGLPGYQPYVTHASVSSRFVSTVEAVLEPIPGLFATGTLSISSDPPGAQVFVDNQSVGLSPFTADDIAEGNHQVALRMTGYQEYTAEVVVPAGATGIVNATLVPVKPPLHTPVHPLAAAGALFLVCYIALRKKQ